MRILLVEDFTELARVIGIVLGTRGHEVVTATTGAEALAHAHSDCFDVILCDLCLPDTSGYALLPKLRSRSDCPIIASSGSLDRSLTGNCLAAGFDGSILKPFCVDDLLELLARIRTQKLPMAAMQAPAFAAEPARSGQLWHLAVNH